MNAAARFEVSLVMSTEGSLEVKLPAYGQMKQQWREEPERRKVKKGKNQKRANKDKENLRQKN